jgi:rhodanese-related sulfurtransferase
VGTLDSLISNWKLANGTHNHGCHIAIKKMLSCSIDGETSATVLEFLVLLGTDMPLPEYKQLVDEAKREIEEIDPGDLKRMQQEKQNFTLIDVREPDEVAEGAIEGSKPLPRGQLEHKIDTITADKNQPIVCYCGGGGRSALAAQSLKKMGFKNVMSLAGGYKGWKGSKQGP